MISTLRCRTLLAALAVCALLLVAAPPALAAAPSANEPQPPSLLAHVVDWLANLGLTWNTGPDASTVATSTTAPNMDPDGILAAPRPNLDPHGLTAAPDLDPNGRSAAPDLDPDGGAGDMAPHWDPNGVTASNDSGEALPNMDPDG